MSIGLRFSAFKHSDKSCGEADCFVGLSRHMLSFETLNFDLSKVIYLPSVLPPSGTGAENTR